MARMLACAIAAALVAALAYRALGVPPLLARFVLYVSTYVLMAGAWDLVAAYRARKIAKRAAGRRPE